MDSWTHLSLAQFSLLMICTIGTFIYAWMTVDTVKILLHRKRTFASFYLISALFSGSVLLIYYLRLLDFNPLPKTIYELALFFFMLLPGILFFVALDHLSKLHFFGARSDTDRFNKLKDEFLTVASHELRTPLSIISGFAEILLREKIGTLNDEQKRRVRKILMQGQRLNRIVDELLDLSRIRSGKVAVRKEIFDLVPVLRVCFEDHQVICEQQNLIFKENIPDLLPDVEGDLDRVTQVVVNLLNNAIKYTPSGGTITMSAMHEKGSRSVIVSVEDTGIGVDPSEHELIFQEFYRSSDPVSRKHSGSGLGLSIVKQLVESQGGLIQIRSEGLGKGSRFSFSLPVAKTVS